jgi:hypothetical protein
MDDPKVKEFFESYANENMSGELKKEMDRADSLAELVIKFS